MVIFREVAKLIGLALEEKAENINIIKDERFESFFEYVLEVSTSEAPSRKYYYTAITDSHRLNWDNYKNKDLVFPKLYMQ